MQWQDEALVLSVRPHGETAAVVELFCREQGRHLGLVHGGRSRKLRPILQIGNHVDASWRARTADHLGQFSVELRKGYAAQAMDSAAALSALNSMAVLLRQLAEREAHSGLFEVSMFLLGFLDDPTVWPALMVRWELALLDELGFGLDLTRCAATGKTEELIFVSPKSGRAVSRTAGAPYADRLLALPPFLAPGRKGTVNPEEIAAGFVLTGHFLKSKVYATEGQALPEACVRMRDLYNTAAAAKA